LEVNIVCDIWRRIGLAEPTHIRRDRVVAFRRKNGQDLAPAVAEFWEAVREQHQRAFALLGDVHPDSVDLDEAVLDAACGRELRSLFGFASHEMSLWSPDRNRKTAATDFKEWAQRLAGPETERSEGEVN
jgi:hypothetical protein